MSNYTIYQLNNDELNNEELNNEELNTQETFQPRKRKSYFLCNRMQKSRNRKEIKENLENFRKFINSIGCEIDYLRLKKRNDEGNMIIF